MSNNNRAFIFGAIAVLCWSTVATAFKIALSYLSYYEMLIVASATALVIFAITITIERKWAIVKALSRRDVTSLAVLGLINPVAYYLILFKAYSLLPAQIAQPINYCWPIFLLILLAIFDHKPISGKKYIGMVISLAGVTVISTGAGAISADAFSALGLALGLASSLFWATYWLLNNKLSTGIDPIVALFVSFIFGMIYLGAGTLVVDVNISNVSGIVSGMYVGCFEIGLPFIFFGMALRLSSNPTLINQMCYFAPFLSLFLIGIVLGEPIVPTTYIGLILILTGVIYNQYFTTPRQQK
jgi:drug/metabolite transporter (DMT)-like permease